MMALAFLSVLALAPAPAGAQGHDHHGHDHGHDHEEAGAAGGLAPRMAARGDEFEIVGILRGAELEIFLDRLADNAPVAGATVELTIDGVTAAADERGNGVYRAAGPWLGRPGPVDIMVSVTAGSVSDLLVGTLDIPGATTSEGWTASLLAGTVTPLRLALAALALFLVGGVAALLLERMARPQPVAVVAALGVAVVLGGAVFASGAPAPDGAAAGAVARSESPRRLPDGDVVMPKPTQRLLALRTALAAEDEVARTVRAVGRMISDPAASGIVQTTVRGRIELADDRWPVVGQKVKRGEILAVVVPTVNPVDRMSIRGQQSMVEREIVVLQKRLEDEEAKADPATAAVDALRAEIALLVRRRGAISQSMVERDQLRLPLYAPIDGTIASARVVPGQNVDYQDVMFEVIDPRRLWVEVSIYDLTILDRIKAATAVTADGRSYPLTFLSRGPRLNQQFVPAFFSVTDERADAVAGTPVTVHIATSESRKGVVLPQTAVVRGQGGQGTVWIHSGPELFLPLPVVTEPIDGRSVLVVNGLEPGQRIVTAGAGLVNQVR